MQANKRVILLGLGGIFLSLVVGLGSAIICFPSGPSLLLFLVGESTGNRDMMTESLKQRYGNQAPEHVGLLIDVSDRRAADDRTAAIKLYNACVQFSPNNVLCYLSRASNYRYLHEYDRALADNTKAVELSPTIRCYLERSITYEAMNKRAEQLSDLIEAQKLGNKNPDLQKKINEVKSYLQFQKNR